MHNPWDDIKLGEAERTCDNCENYQKKEVKREYNDEFQIRYNKKDVLVVKDIFIENWWENDEKYWIAYITKTNVRTTNDFPKGKFDKLKITQSR